MPLSDYPAYELEPRRLSPEEIENPNLVLCDFFSYAHLPQVREHFWEFFKALVVGNYTHLERREKNDLIFLYEKLAKLIEAAHLIYRENKTTTGSPH